MFVFLFPPATLHMVPNVSCKNMAYAKHRKQPSVILTTYIMHVMLCAGSFALLLGISGPHFDMLLENTWQ